MVDEDVLLADGGEEVGRGAVADRLERRRGEPLGHHGLVGLELEVGAVDVAEFGKAQEVDVHRHVVDVAGVDVELVAQPAFRGGRCAGFHLDADDPGEASLLEVGLDRLQEVGGVEVVFLDARRAGDAEGDGLVEAHAGEEVVEVVADDVVDLHEPHGLGGPLAVGQGDEPLDVGGELQPRVEALAALVGRGRPAARGDGAGVERGLGEHREVGREVADEGESVGGIDGQGRQRGEDVGAVPLLCPLAVLARHVGPADDAHALAIERGLEFLRVDLDLRMAEFDHRGTDGHQLLAGRHAVGPGQVDARVQGALEQPHPLHEELVEVAREDREEADAIEEGQALISRLREHAAVELQPRQVAVEVPGLGCRPVGGGVGLLARGGHERVHMHSASWRFGLVRSIVALRQPQRASAAAPPTGGCGGRQVATHPGASVTLAKATRAPVGASTWRRRRDNSSTTCLATSSAVGLTTSKGGTSLRERLWKGATIEASAT